MRDQFNFKVNWWVIGGFSSLLLLFLVSGFLGLYAMQKSANDTTRYIQAIDKAREVQVEFQKQFHLWKSAVLEGERFADFRKHYHAFTFHADRVQDSLFNLKLICGDFEGVPDKIVDLRGRHKMLTNEFTSHLMSLKESNFKNRADVIASVQGKDGIALKKMEEIAVRIEEIANAEIFYLNNYYFNVVLVSLAIITGAAIVMSVYVASNLLNAHRKLEMRVRERTADLREANRELESEIKERKTAQESLMRSMKEIEEANRRIHVSEEKYRLLVEGSNDIIFSLDDQLQFITANRALQKHLKMSPDEISRYSFFDLLYDSSEVRSVTLQLVKEKIEHFLVEKTPVHFRAELQSAIAAEPKEMDVWLEFINIEGKNEILGKASDIREDALLKYFINERQRFRIGNYLITAEDVTRRMTRNLLKYLDAKIINLMRIALREIIINAIEHGNLNISFKEKSRAMMEDRYFEFVAERQNNPQYRRRQVEIEYLITPEKVIYKVSDEGDGFDHQNVLDRDLDTVNTEMMEHGRGIAMVKQIFDEVQYNNKGNQVMLIKHFAEKDSRPGNYTVA